MIRAMSERNKGRLKLPIVKGKYIGSVSDRASLQDKAKMETYVQSKGWTTFDEMQADREAVQADYDRLEKSRSDMDDRMGYLEGLLGYYNDHYEHYHEINAGYWKLKKAEEKNGKPLGFFKKSQAQQYKMQHQTEMNTYKIHRDVLKGMIKEPDKRIDPKSWRKEYDALVEKYNQTQKPYSAAVIDLAKIEVLNHNRSDLDRMLENESHKREQVINHNLSL